MLELSKISRLSSKIFGDQLKKQKEFEINNYGRRKNIVNSFILRNLNTNHQSRKSNFKLSGNKGIERDKQDKFAV